MFSLSVDEVGVVWGGVVLWAEEALRAGSFYSSFSASFGLWVSVGGGILGL